MADEVRNLAMRAAEAAKNTGNLIEGTVSKIQGGVDLVQVASEAFSQVIETSGKVGSLVTEISGASGEQARGFEQINKALGEMDKGIQQLASNSEESSGAASEMKSQTVKMTGSVNELSLLVGARQT